MEITESQSGYLKLIFELIEDGIEPTNKIISERMDISPPSVSEMIKKLRQMKLLKEDSLYLTEEGMEVSREIVSKHRLWEAFLMEILDYSWEEVHEDAEKLEAVSGKKLYDRMNRVLGGPHYCPHGKPIYYNIDERSPRIPLYCAEIGGEYQIVEVVDDTGLLDYCTDKGLAMGTRFRVLDKNDYDQSMILGTRADEIELSPKVCHNIKVKPVEEE